ncbi:MAG TPA: DedA family protein [Acetobacteraceae bacterium]|nr:DedA family protein [Acetobacteraceae bacterium]
MTQGIVASLAAFIIATISAGGYLGIVALMTIESACIPLPSEIIMTFSGYLAFTGRFNLFLVATAGAIGCNVGSAIAYAVGNFGGRPAVLRWGRYVLLSAAELDRVERYFARFGSITVLVARLLPVVRTFIALPAGIARMPQWRFHIYTFVGSWPFCFLLAFIGMKLGQKWDSDPRLRAVMSRLDLVVLAVLVLGFAWFVWNRWRHRRRPTQ